MKNAGSLFLSLNTEGGNVPSRIQLIPAPDRKTIVGVDGRKWTLSDSAALCAAMNAKNTMFPIDENHSTDLAAPKGEPSPALGWFHHLTAQGDGSVWADVQWNARGENALRNKEYRYISPVFLCDKEKRITEILRAALTNNPNLDNPALNSKSQVGELAEEKNMDKELCAALGLPETATKDEVLAAVARQKAELNVPKDAPNGQKVDLTAYAPRADLNAMEARAVEAEKKVAELNAARLKADAEKAVDGAIANRKIAPASREAYLELCASEKGLEQFRAIVAASPAVIGEGGVPNSEPPNGKGQSVALNASEKQLASSMGYTEEEFEKMRKAGE